MTVISSDCRPNNYWNNSLTSKGGKVPYENTQFKNFFHTSLVKTLSGDVRLAHDLFYRLSFKMPYAYQKATYSGVASIFGAIAIPAIFAKSIQHLTLPKKEAKKMLAKDFTDLTKAVKSATIGAALLPIRISQAVIDRFFGGEKLTLTPCPAILTANTLGVFSDPFEFAGNYGEAINSIRALVFEKLVSKQAHAQNLSDKTVQDLLQKSGAAEPITEEAIRLHRQKLVQEAVFKDKNHGPTFSEIVSDQLKQKLTDKQKELNNPLFTDQDLNDFITFITKYHNQKAFYFLRNNPKDFSFVPLDKQLRQNASKMGTDLDLGIISSTALLKGTNAEELKSCLIDQLFTEKNLDLAEPLEDSLQTAYYNLNLDNLKQWLNFTAEQTDLKFLCTPGGQVLFYWLYQSLNLHLSCENKEMITNINQVKTNFNQTLGNPETRAQLFAEKIATGNFGVVFTQEGYAQIKGMLQSKFIPVDDQNSTDGTWVFLNNEYWTDPHIVRLEDTTYPDRKKGKLNLVMATSNLTREKFLFASCHGDSKKAEDGRNQISLVMKEFEKLSSTYPGLQLFIGTDANTKSAEDIRALLQQADELGLMATRTGSTTIKQRKVSVQHDKAEKKAEDREDFMFCLKPEFGGNYIFSNFTLGFKEVETSSSTDFLPSIENPSDHYPVGATIKSVTDPSCAFAPWSW